jgi:hypothetical protein
LLRNGTQAASTVFQIRYAKNGESCVCTFTLAVNLAPRAAPDSVISTLADADTTV